MKVESREGLCEPLGVDVCAANKVCILESLGIVSGMMCVKVESREGLREPLGLENAANNMCNISEPPGVSVCAVDSMRGIKKFCTDFGRCV
jgi:hypothetical protein